MGYSTTILSPFPLPTLSAPLTPKTLFSQPFVLKPPGTSLQTECSELIQSPGAAEHSSLSSLWERERNKAPSRALSRLAGGELWPGGDKWPLARR